MTATETFNVASLKGLPFIYDSYPGLTTGATIVPPFGLCPQARCPLPSVALLSG
jgi:hypothetical protein